MERLLALDPAAGFAEELRLQALIAAVHAVALSTEETDWPLALTFYDRLLAMSGDDPVIRLNRAVAVARVNGAKHALAELDGLDPRDHRTAGALAELHAEAGNLAHARRLFASAADWCACAPVRRHYRRRRDSMTQVVE
ncbi:hypothetical protein EHW97_01720 [Aeromicrobium camelliae]|uniref:Tetratricopeptide repeat protein n=1 Tax=Aeromicrobium camelliae TaxID=1538144 RepID=A0A3N6X7G2_9ACTN|nr:hypothetical protein [Aeromicrobium camelliae]RQN09593.1 hypothetical protein EHW97_01720 [Aeromicrobium camelliae]